jgi:hypothetical protein
VISVAVCAVLMRLVVQVDFGQAETSRGAFLLAPTYRLRHSEVFCASHSSSSTSSSATIALKGARSVTTLLT